MTYIANREAFGQVPPKRGSERFTRSSDPSFQPATLWTAFTNPTLRDRLAINIASGQLHVVQQGSLSEPPLIEVPKVTEQEHRQILREFLNQIEPLDRPLFQTIASTPNPWPTWSWRIKDFSNGKYMSAWLDFRTAALKKLLRERLAQLDLEGGMIESFVVNVLETKQRRFRENKHNLQGRRGFASIKNCLPVSVSENEMRRIASYAVSQMNVEELSRLWLPLGLVVNSFRGHES